MPSKQARLPTAFGTFSKLPAPRIDQIRSSAKAAVRAWKAGDTATWQQIISAANRTLSKHETGVFSGFMIIEADK
jgi:hypothetical protein